jgi:L-alanine-DL-glutamate epimerase-like enolase superfamily enzyme
MLRWEVFVKLESIELREVRVKLRFRFETSFGVEEEMRRLLVIIRSEGLEGYGECTAGNFPGYSYESVDTCWLALKDHIVPRVIGSRPATMRSAVVLPQPEGPTRTTSSPSAMSASRLRMASVPSG